MTADFVIENKGAIAPMLSLSFLVIIGCMGIAIDTSRSMLVKARLTNALDSAGLAVGARLATTDFVAEGKKFVAANFGANTAAATITNVTVVPNADKTVFTLSATATMPTAFMKLFGVNAVTVNASTEITRASSGLELAMVLDNTGSMEESSSMPALKSAANSLVATLFGSDTTAANLYVGLVPFSQAVNIGTGRTGWVTPASLQTATNPYYPSLWTGCVEARLSGLDQTDDPPAAASSNFKAYYSPDSAYNDWIKYRLGILFPYTDVYYTAYNAQQGPGAYCPQPMTFLTNNKATITSAISDMKAAGSTMINLGAIWGWRMLSPRWRGYWATDSAGAKLPLDYKLKNANKAVVIMTDGNNSFAANNYTAYGTLAEARLGSAKQTTAEGVLDTRLAAACSSMKTAGIQVYTVAFDNPDAATKSLLETCATSASFYFDAANTAALTAAFQTIGGSLSRLRVSR
ncbi:pilus assembly protein [Methylopila sp. M107]|uniref:pilus assembly protein n=1 Tax=Methylopila sp. M107 TaxID=1101190 RepID=UPI002476F7BC|nr:pilus assembly protein [Methylopila sp. M107]